VDSPDGKEVFILCRSRDRAEKEKAIHDRFERRIEEALIGMEKSCAKRRYQINVMERRIGRLLGRNSRAAGLFDVRVRKVLRVGRKSFGQNGRTGGTVRLSEGCYMLRSNIRDWSPEELWKAYIQLTEAEEAFRIHKGDLSVRPIWHQKEERVRAHILVCFLAYVLWKTLDDCLVRPGLEMSRGRSFRNSLKSN